MNIYIFTVIWFLCGFIGYGLMYAYFVRKYAMIKQKRTDDILLAIFGPIDLAVSLYFLYVKNGFTKMFKYGFKL